MVQALNDNAELREVMTHVQLPTKMDLKVPVAGGFTARVRLLLPPNFDKSGRTKYPLLFYVYVYVILSFKLCNLLRIVGVSACL